MTQTHGAAAVPSSGISTRTLLTLGAFAGPVYVVVVAVQVLTREGFDVTRHAASQLANGPAGWVQIANFLLTGALVIAGAIGLRRTWRAGVGRRWVPILLGTFGASLIAGGVFTADPALGFPPGTPAGMGPVSWHGLLHLICGSIGFLGLIIGCMVVARRFFREGNRGWGSCSVATGVIFLASFVGIASGSGGPTTIGFVIGVVVAFGWLTALMYRLIERKNR